MKRCLAVVVAIGLLGLPRVARPDQSKPANEKDKVEVLPDPGTLEKYRGQFGKVLYFEVVGTSSGLVWGSGPYTDDSRLAAAATHAGVVKIGQKAVVKVTILEGQSSYRGSTANRVVTLNWKDHPCSFQVEPVKK